MVMEFWTGWFDHWDEPIHNTWDPAGKFSFVLNIINIY